MADPWSWRSDMDAPQPRNYLQPTLKPGPAPTGYDRVFDTVYNYLGGTPDKRPVANALAAAFDVGTLGMATGAYDGAMELATTGRPAALAMALMPGARAGKAAAKAVEAVPHTVVPHGLRAYHGSPHDFDRFSLDKIGTGEGAQAFGHGLYFAENEAVARQYRDTLGDYSGNVKWTGAEPPDDLQRALLKQLAGTDARGEMMTVDKLRRELLSIRRASAVMDDDGRIVAGPGAKGDEYRRATALYEELGRSDGLIRIDPPGRLYEVRINAEPDDFLDWDRPLAEQPAIQSAIERAGLMPYTVVDDAGSRVDLSRGLDKAKAEAIAAARGGRAVPKSDADFDAVKKAYGLGDPSKAAAISTALRDAGIPGIRYLDQGSRTAGEGTRNYVVFDDKLIEIMRKYGLAPPALAGGYAAFPGNAEANQ